MQSKGREGRGHHNSKDNDRRSSGTKNREDFRRRSRQPEWSEQSEEESDSDAELSSEEYSAMESSGRSGSDDESRSERGSSDDDAEDSSESVSQSEEGIRDDDEEDAERRGSHARASTSAKALKKMVTQKAVVQEGEVTDLPIPSKFPQKPMVEMVASSNVWYQAYVIKESANEVKVRFPGVNGSHKEKLEWLRKGTCRIWRGSLKGSDWKHLGKGAWAPRTDAARRSRRNGTHGRHAMRRTNSKGKRQTGRKHWPRASGRSETSPDYTTENTQGGKDSHQEDEVMSPRPAQTSGTQQQRRLQEEHSDREHASTHSPNVAESPGVFADQNSARFSPSDEVPEGHIDPPVQHDPDYDPLAKWFEAHLTTLATEGRLSVLQYGMPEAGVLPPGYVWDSTTRAAVAAPYNSKPAAGSGKDMVHDSKQHGSHPPLPAGKDSSNAGVGRKRQHGDLDSEDAKAAKKLSGYSSEAVGFSSTDLPEDDQQHRPPPAEQGNGGMGPGAHRRASDPSSGKQPQGTKTNSCPQQQQHRQTSQHQPPSKQARASRRNLIISDSEDEDHGPSPSISPRQHGGPNSATHQPAVKPDQGRDKEQAAGDKILRLPAGVSPPQQSAGAHPPKQQSGVDRRLSTVTNCTAGQSVQQQQQLGSAASGPVAAKFPARVGKSTGASSAANNAAPGVCLSSMEGMPSAPRKSDPDGLASSKPVGTAASSAGGPATASAGMGNGQKAMGVLTSVDLDL